MKRVLLFGSVPVIAIPLSLLVWFFYVTSPQIYDFGGFTKHYMSLPQCNIHVGDTLTEIGPPKGFDACKFEGMIGDIPHQPFVIRDVESPPVHMGILRPGESEEIRLFGQR